jgi:hypothetical protein
MEIFFKFEKHVPGNNKTTKTRSLPGYTVLVLTLTWLHAFYFYIHVNQSQNVFYYM